MDTDKILLTIREVAKIVGVCPRTIWNWIKKGQLPATMLGGLYFIHRDDLNNIINKQKK